MLKVELEVPGQVQELIPRMARRGKDSTMPLFGNVDLQSSPPMVSVFAL